MDKWMDIIINSYHKHIQGVTELPFSKFLYRTWNNNAVINEVFFLSKQGSVSSVNLNEKGGGFSV